MAALKSPQESAPRLIPRRLLIGRSPACSLRLVERHVSGEHATILWTGSHWEVRDLGSRNGTYLNGTRIEMGQSVRLTRGNRLAFGDSTRTWTFINDDAPSIMAVHRSTGHVVGGEQDLLLLPTAEHPQVCIFGDDRGGWQIEDGRQGARDLHDQEVVATAAGEWLVLLPGVPDGTPLLDAQLPFDAISLRFSVSRNEERVKLTVFAHGIEKELPEREHSYVLLTLARARQDDASLPVDQRGWLDRERLQRMLATDANSLNVAIYRARQQLSEAGVHGAARLVEVRPRQRRLGTDRFQIARWC